MEINHANQLLVVPSAFIVAVLSASVHNCYRNEHEKFAVNLSHISIQLHTSYIPFMARFYINVMAKLQQYYNYYAP